MNYDIAIVDSGVANVHSVLNAVRQYTSVAIVTDDPEVIKNARGLILPGVGTFRAGMEGLTVRGLTEAVLAFANAGKPILGICLGAQLLLTKGYEFGEWDGLNLVPGKVVKFEVAQGVRLPHIGWNSVYGFAPHTPLLEGVRENADMYFVHSYILKPEDESHRVARTSYGDTEFVSVIRKGNIYGTQFHPEKSSRVGMQIIENFVTLARS